MTNSTAAKNNTTVAKNTAASTQSKSAVVKKRALALAKSTAAQSMDTATKARYAHRCLGKGIYVSNDTRVTHLNNNDIIVGSAGSCKTGSVVYPQLKTLGDSSLIVADSKNMLHRMFRDELKSKGYRVRVLDFVNPEQSCMYNPLDYVRQEADGAYNEIDIMKISRSLIPDTLDAHDPFWAISGRAVLEFFISYTLAALPEEDHNMYTVSRLYHAFSKDKDMGDLGFIDWIEDHPGSLVANRYAQIKGMQHADKMWSSILGFVNVALYPFDVAILHHIFETDMHSDREDAELDLASLGREKTVLFLNISDTDHSLDSLVNLFYTQALQTLVSEADKQENGQLTVPTRIIFDDFAAGTVIPDFDKVISVIRSRDIWATILIQSFSQLDSLYSASQSLTIQNNCDHMIYMGSNDLISAEYIGTRAGKVPEEILSMDRSKEYFIEGGKKAILVDKVQPYSYTEDDAPAV